MSDYNEHLISMAGGDGGQLDQIQRRADVIQRCMDAAPNDSYDMSDIGGALDAAANDVPYLLALVREQAAKLKRVEALADKLETFAANTRGFNPTRHAGWDGKASDYDRQARAIHTALEAAS